MPAESVRVITSADRYVIVTWRRNLFFLPRVRFEIRTGGHAAVRTFDYFFIRSCAAARSCQSSFERARVRSLRQMYNSLTSRTTKCREPGLSFRFDTSRAVERSREYTSHTFGNIHYRMRKVHTSFHIDQR